MDATGLQQVSLALVMSLCLQRVLVNFPSSFLPQSPPPNNKFSGTDPVSTAGLSGFYKVLQDLVWFLYVSWGFAGFHLISACLIVLVLLALIGFYWFSAVCSCAASFSSSKFTFSHFHPKWSD